MSDLRQRDVVNINDGKRLGLVSDVDVDPETGRILALIVPGPGKLFGLFGAASDYVIHWNRIVRIGPDVILVDWNAERERGPGSSGGAFSGGFPTGFAGQAGPAGFPPGAAGIPAGFPGAGGLPPNLVQAGPGGAPPGAPRSSYVIPGPASMGGVPGGIPQAGAPHVGPGPVAGAPPAGGIPPGMVPPGPPPEVEPDQDHRRRRQR